MSPPSASSAPSSAGDKTRPSSLPPQVADDAVKQEAEEAQTDVNGNDREPKKGEDGEEEGSAGYGENEEDDEEGMD
ncbi:hypothetical protein KEM56_004790, partial [Ascosphaera pollenicola]